MNEMIELGKVQKLTVIREKKFGIYLGEKGSAEGVLLPAKQVPEGTVLGDELEVFIYRDSGDRLIATTRRPYLQMGETAVLEVADLAGIGAFLNWGLEKDLLLPHREQTRELKKGDRILAALYEDRSRRLCATMRVYDYLSGESPYQLENMVSGTVYQVNPQVGVFVAVDNKYYGLIPAGEVFREYQIGDSVAARVVRVREDGKLDLAARRQAYLQMDDDAEMLFGEIEKRGGSLPFGEKADPELIRSELHLSKNAFKRALGRLLKEEKIVIEENGIRMIKK